jgi:hypothetical protein
MFIRLICLLPLLLVVSMSIRLVMMMRRGEVEG